MNYAPRWENETKEEKLPVSMLKGLQAQLCAKENMDKMMNGEEEGAEPRSSYSGWKWT